MSKVKDLADKITNLKLEIGIKNIELLNFRKELLDEMIINGVKNVQGQLGKIKLIESKNKYHNALKGEFKSLKISEKRELYKTGLLNISFRLRPKNYQEFIKNNPSNPLDRFVKIKNNPYSILVNLDKKTLEKLKLEREDLAKLSDQDRDSLMMELDEMFFADEDMDEDMYEINEEFNDGIGDSDYLSNFTDDDLSDLDSAKERELGLLDKDEYSDEDNR